MGDDYKFMAKYLFFIKLKGQTELFLIALGKRGQTVGGGDGPTRY